MKRVRGRYAVGRGVAVGAWALLGVSGCGGAAAREIPVAAAVAPAGTAGAREPLCRVDGAGWSLPAEVRETSGLARGRRNRGIFWTHNDSGGDPELFALDAQGRLVGRARVPGAGATDWEDLEEGPCPEGACLYVADTGDNAERRDHVTVYRVPEPARGASETARATPFPARFPDRPQDTEALFVLPPGRVFLVTKGRHGPVSLYRYPSPLRSGDTVALEPVRQLLSQPGSPVDWVTAATATPDGEWVAVRSYRTLYLYRARELTGTGTAAPRVVDLTGLRERQGEAVAVDDDGTVWLTSEAETGGLPRGSRLRCTLPRRGR